MGAAIRFESCILCCCDVEFFFDGYDVDSACIFDDLGCLGGVNCELFCGGNESITFEE